MLMLKLYLLIQLLLMRILVRVGQKPPIHWKKLLILCVVAYPKILFGMENHGSRSLAVCGSAYRAGDRKDHFQSQKIAAFLFKLMQVKSTLTIKLLGLKILIKPLALARFL